MTARIRYLVTAVCLALLPRFGLADDSWSPGATYCRISPQDTSLVSGLCHDNYDYMIRISREEGDIVTFRNGAAEVEGRVSVSKIQDCIVRADLSLVCFFDAVAGND